jgi:hypothetical protein
LEIKVTRKFAKSVLFEILTRPASVVKFTSMYPDHIIQNADPGEEHIGWISLDTKDQFEMCMDDIAKYSNIDKSSLARAMLLADAFYCVFETEILDSWNLAKLNRVIQATPAITEEELEYHKKHYGYITIDALMECPRVHT